ncbi:MAG: cyclic nucleotide-binding domain-containing protein [Xanthomonadales bacterium]|nr:cyclic nucleotide-binding domain-containing protein [Xanthomonadales bacterium]
MRQTGCRGAPIIPILDDGDEFSFCTTCAFSSACLAEGYDKSQLRDLHCLVEHEGPFTAGAHLFREGDLFTSIAAVRAGTVKTYVVDERGREQVHGFFLPGEVIGLSAIHGERYPCNAQALDTVTVCRFSFPLLAACCFSPAPALALLPPVCDTELSHSGGARCVVRT